MASASASNATRLCILACRQSSRLRTASPRVQSITRSSPSHLRTFTSTTTRWADEPPKNEKQATQKSGEGTKPTASEPTTEKAAPSKSQQPFGNQSIEAQSYEVLDITAKNHGYGTFDEYIEAEIDKGLNSAKAERELDAEVMPLIEPKPEKRSPWFDREDEEMDTEDVEEFEEDDMTELGHAKLEEIKEMRHYARLAIWELPLLSKLAKPFEPPTNKQVLRWRYTTYMGDTHPAEKKVVVEFAPDDLGLTKVQTGKLKKLAGPRYNPEKEVVKMSCESYELQAQNKRYLLDLVDNLVATAKDPKDTFEDVPLDTRHHQIRPKPRFPKEWLMTEERRRLLDQQREQLRLAEVQRIDSGQLVDGQQAIEGYLVEKMKEEQLKAEKEAVTIAAPARSNARAGKGRGNRL